MKRALLAILVLILIASSAVACSNSEFVVQTENDRPEFVSKKIRIEKCVFSIFKAYDWREISRHGGNTLITVALYCAEERNPDPVMRKYFFDCVLYMHRTLNLRDLSRHGGNQLIALGILCVPE